MASTELTHLWIEAPFLSDALKQIPAHVKLLYPAAPPVDPLAQAQPVQAILASSLLQYNGQLMDRLPNLRIIARTGIGYDNVVVDDATARASLFVIRPMARPNPRRNILLPCCWH
ncbi:MAG: hypothetical protein HC808_18480 [Candidatus Competibacteraceae bacterium]|nr:hypothetical protein [Candidatus Competibacteraceae bacterium]